MSWDALIHNNFLIKLLAACAELAVGFFLGPFIKRLIMRLHNRKGVDEGVLTFAGSLASIFIRLLALIIALGQIGVDMSVAVGAFSALGLGISLALKESMANVAGGMQILITKPFKVGDYIECETLEGTVRSIEIMFTTLETFDMQEVVIPNAQLIANALTNYSVNPNRRLVYKIPVNSSADAEAFRAQLQTIMEDEPLVLQDPKPKTVIGDYIDQGRGVEVGMICYSTINDFWDMKYALTEKVQALRKSGVIAVPTDLIEVRQG